MCVGPLCSDSESMGGSVPLQKKYKISHDLVLIGSHDIDRKSRNEFPRSRFRGEMRHPCKTEESSGFQEFASPLR